MHGSYNEAVFRTPILTLDVDWAPDCVIEAVAEILISASVRATWFVTHLSPAILRLRNQPDLFELGIHPNFFPGSSHGSDPTAVIRHCLALVPEARAVRTHGLVQSTNLLAQMFRDAPQLNIDTSILLPRASFAEPHTLPFVGRAVTRLPYVWEDDVEMVCEDGWWRLEDCASLRGLVIFDFHPIHVFMNARRLSAYDELKQRVGQLSSARPNQIQVEPPTELGPGRLFREIVAHLASAGRSLRISDVVPNGI